MTFRIMTLLLRTIILAFALCSSLPASAEQQDIAAAARGVVRVVIVATNGSEAYFVGHGSGVAITPNKILTNAHVVELTRQEKNLVIGIVPSEGTKSFGGRVIAFSPGNDLALIQLEEGSLPVATFYAGALSDGQHVTAIGYPGTVDRAQGLGLKQLVEPLQTVKTSGNVSSGRSSQSFDTILHTAPLAAGNSGGPLIDDCGRILGINSFGSVSDGNDAEFGFAVSWREITSFLRQAGVTPQHTVIPCRSMAEANAAEASIAQREAQATDYAQRNRDAARERTIAAARENAEHEIIARRENAMAGAAILLAIAVLTFGAGGFFYIQKREKRATYAFAGGGILLLSAFGLFVMRPSFASVDEKVRNATSGEVTSNDAFKWSGDNACRIDTNRSRLTVSPANDFGFNWSDSGCADGSAQFIKKDPEWQRTSVNAQGHSVSTNSFDPITGLWRTERWLPDADIMAKIIAINSDKPITGCPKDSDSVKRIAEAQTQMRALLSSPANERIVYRCQKGRIEQKLAE